MPFLMHFSQLRTGNVGVNLSSRNVFVAKHFLHVTKACAVRKQISCKTVADTMRTNFDRQVGLSAVGIDSPLNTPGSQAHWLAISWNVLLVAGKTDKHWTPGVVSGSEPPIKPLCCPIA